MRVANRKAHAASHCMDLDKTSSANEYSKVPTIGKRQQLKGFKVQITDIGDASSEDTKYLIELLTNAGVTDIRYWSDCISPSMYGA